MYKVRIFSLIDNIIVATSTLAVCVVRVHIYVQCILIGVVCVKLKIIYCIFIIIIYYIHTYVHTKVVCMYACIYVTIIT